MSQGNVVRLEDLLKEPGAVGLEGEPEMDQGQINRSAAQSETLIDLGLPVRIPLVEDTPAVKIDKIHEIHGGFQVAAMEGAKGVTGIRFQSFMPFSPTLRSSETTRESIFVQSAAAFRISSTASAGARRTGSGRLPDSEHPSSVEMIRMIVGDKHQVHAVKRRRALHHLVQNLRCRGPVFRIRLVEEGVDQDLGRARADQDAELAT